uniref:Asialoglycoprotein receptor 1-like n=1 Tax=Seriola lalandi dorsalis TaxID=1841481 RepID=A0A3B4YA89_SERLL
MSDSYLTLTKVKNDLRKDNELLKEHSGRLDEQNKLLNRTSAQLKSMNLALSLESGELMEQIENLTYTNTQLTQEHKQLVQYTSEQEEKKLNMSETIKHLVSSNTQLQEEKQRLSETNSLLRDELLQRICKKCPDSWRLLETKCYYFSSRMLSWSSSRAWCRTQGGDLLIINSEQEQSITRLWIGLTDAEEEDDWRWVDGSKVNSDPDDWKLDDPLGEDCGHVDTSENALKSWMDGSCKKPYRWICEKNI